MSQFFDQIIKDYPEFEYDSNNPNNLICVHNNKLLCRIEMRENSANDILYRANMYRPIGLSSYYYSWQSFDCKNEYEVTANIKKIPQLIEKLDKLTANTDDSIHKLEQLGFIEKTVGEYWLQLKDLLVVIIIPHVYRDRCYLKYKVEVSNGPYSVLLRETCDSLEEALSKLTD